MNYNKHYRIWLFLLCILLSQSSGFAQIPAQTGESKTQEKLIHFGDLIDVDVVGSLEYDWRGTLNPEGFLDGIDFVEEPIYALCRSETEIATAVVAGYSKILREPKVVVTVLDRSNRALSVLQGAVKRTQRFQIKRPVYLNELLILSGGLTDKVSGEIQIFRPPSLSCETKKQDEISADATNGENRDRFVKTSRSNGAQTFNIKITDLLSGNQEANPQILSGDIITVLEAEPIYVIGGVNTPKQIAVRSEITLSRAIAGAGGLTKDAVPGSITIFRREKLETKIIEADLTKIEAKQSEDIILKRFDIVEVGQKGREKRKSPPVLQMFNSEMVNSVNAPLRIID